MWRWALTKIDKSDIFAAWLILRSIFQSSILRVSISRIFTRRSRTELETASSPLKNFPCCSVGRIRGLSLASPTRSRHRHFNQKNLRWTIFAGFAMPTPYRFLSVAIPSCEQPLKRNGEQQTLHRRRPLRSQIRRLTTRLAKCWVSCLTRKSKNTTKRPNVPSIGFLSPIRLNGGIGRIVSTERFNQASDLIQRIWQKRRRRRYGTSENWLRHFGRKSWNSTAGTLFHHLTKTFRSSLENRERSVLLPCLRLINRNRRLSLSLRISPMNSCHRHLTQQARISHRIERSISRFGLKSKSIPVGTFWLSWLVGCQWASALFGQPLPMRPYQSGWQSMGGLA